MEFVVCDGEWSHGANDELLCSGQLVLIEYTPLHAVGPEDAAQISAAVLLMFAVAFGLKYVRKFIWR